MQHRLDLSWEFFTQFNQTNQAVPIQVGLYQFENAEHGIICTISVNPKEQFKLYGIYSETNKKSKGVRRDFLCEVSLYLKIRILELKMLFGNDCKYLYSLSEKVHKRFRRFRKKLWKDQRSQLYLWRKFTQLFFEIPICLIRSYRNYLQKAE